MTNLINDKKIPWFALEQDKVVDLIETDLKYGLSAELVKKKQTRDGLNYLHEKKKERFWEEFLEELTEPLILLLVLTAIIYIIIGETFDGIVIFGIILLLNAIEVINDNRADNAMNALHDLAEPNAIVIRNNVQIEIPIIDLVKGDIILLHAGERVPADIRIIESYGLAVDESTLTGESIPIEKDSLKVLSEDTPITDHSNMVYNGTLITRGRGRGIVVEIGMHTELGKIIGITQEIEETPTILQKTMDELSIKLVWIAIFFSISIPILGVVIANEPLDLMIVTGLSLAFATIPEELPIIITMVLALGAYTLSKNNVIVRNLKVIETLGMITTVATDKTGTLTKNELEIAEFFPPTEQKKLLLTGILCNDSMTEKISSYDDPLELALLLSAQKSGFELKEIQQKHQRIQEFPFDTNRKMMSIITKENLMTIQSSSQNQKYYNIWVKGSPENIIQNSTKFYSDNSNLERNNKQYTQILNKITEMTAQGLRVIGLATKITNFIPTSQTQAENDLTFIGLIGFFDPPREEVKSSIKSMQEGGVRTIMITGDHSLTARAIANKVGLDTNQNLLTGSEIDVLSEEDLRKVVQKTTIFARTTPEQKLKIVKSLQENGECVAVTGDGLNDAPALIRANIGIAMGKGGTDIARESADLVLIDDNYQSFTIAVHEGRRLYANLRKGVRYYLAIKIALVLIMLFPILLKIPVPFAPIQIIFIELFMDLAAAITFSVEKEENYILFINPRNPDHPFMDKYMVITIILSSFVISMIVLVAYIYTWNLNRNLLQSQTVAFVTWMISHVFLAMNMRTEHEPLIQIGLFSNSLIVLWFIASVLLVLLLTSISFFNPIFKITSLRLERWVLIVIIAFIGTFWVEILKLFTFKSIYEK